MRITWDYDTQSFVIRHGGLTEFTIPNEFFQDGNEIEILGIRI